MTVVPPGGTACAADARVNVHSGAEKLCADFKSPPARVYRRSFPRRMFCFGSFRITQTFRLWLFRRKLVLRVSVR